MSQFHTLTIKSVEKLTDKAVSIAFTVPSELKEAFTFTAGQYITLKTAIDGKDIRRDYSICASPKSGELKVAVKQVENGTFSVFANTQLKAGDTLGVATPKGRFTFVPNDSKTKHIAAFAAGSGITPVLGIVKCALEEEVQSHVVLVYGNKSIQDTMFYDELIALQKQYTERLAIQFVFSQTPEDDAVFGRIEKSTVNLVLKNRYKHIDVDDYYLCGPEGMINTVKNVLTESGTEENRIHFELFKAAKNEADDNSNTADGNTKVTVIVDDEEATFDMSQKQSILEAAIDEDLDVPYSCQGGICSSCLARLKEGEAKMRQNNILTDSEVAEGLILTCQAHPTTATVVVDYDDI